MVDKAHTIPRAKAGSPFGELELRTLKEVDRSLAVFLGLA
jgi:mRNA-degrading endonuclease toxin of MazEF toxin-antitoxin module